MKRNGRLKSFLVILFIAMLITIILYGFSVYKQQKEEIGRQTIAKEAAQAEAQREKAEREAAQVKAEKEKIEKEAAQEAARKKQEEIEAEEERQRILDEDKDGDGLTFREEQALGTSDLNSDSDGDYVPDKHDEHPIGGGRTIPIHLEWFYKTGTWKWDLTISSDLASYYETIERPKWPYTKSEFAKFVDYKNPKIISMAKGLKSSADKEGYNYYETIMFITKVAKYLPYIKDETTGFDQYTKFPLQTLMDGGGDCEDAAVLSASLIKALNYDVKLFHLIINDKTAHIALAVWGHETKEGVHLIDNGKKYFYVETAGYEREKTIPSRDFGEIPSTWSSAKLSLIDI